MLVPAAGRSSYLAPSPLSQVFLHWQRAAASTKTHTRTPGLPGRDGLLAILRLYTPVYKLAYLNQRRRSGA
ncbi:hypothetical protein BR93DRAFT_927603 [Coniochaeta sp. PMI_546]|nr:hypothetical protein BR93DRAFT_927603 [Coniochaeta sp. PMI_546]